MSAPKLSALVVAHNEEAQLADCLERLTFADEIVVVLDRCTDRSVEIAARFNARIIEGAWPLEGPRRNTGIEACSGDWILEVDADERVPAEMAREIRDVIASAPFGHILVPFDNYVGKRLVRWGWGGAFGVMMAPRLFAKGAKRWGEQRVHPALELKGEKRFLKSRMIHYVDRDITDMIARLNRYTSARAADLRARAEAGEDIGSFRANVRRIFSRFYKCYVTRKGYREGQYGFLIALMAGLYPLLSYLKATLEKE
ncbi:glycosyltransferase family 2 protein [Ferrovibrio sp.]|jgi:glycosyltransferase involved in cell wall biosynthesis|uniref:glycosyltransferase family 2 protein n=1 Tax=Ferrovibrio sp. TaxID=1917215 RepID=UPI0035B11B4D